MAVVSASEFVTRYPEFGNLSDDYLDVILEEAEQDTPYSVWETRQARGIKLLAAHRLTLQARSGAIALSTGETGITSGLGAVLGTPTSLSASQDSSSVSFSDPLAGASSSDDEGLKSTLYGLEYLKLKRSLPITGFVW